MDLSQIVLADVSWFLQWGFWTAAAKAVLGFGIVIFVHELGHFLVAKWCGVKCEKFYVGFDVPIRLGPIRLPRALFRKSWGETEYGIGIIPLGGYVKMLGQDDNPANTQREAERIRMKGEQAEDGPDDASPEKQGASGDQLDPRSYPAKSVPQRTAIISAGVIMNLVFAVIFGMIAYGMGVSYMPAQVGGTTPGFAAWQVGFRPGDQILQIGRHGKRTEHLRFDKDLRVAVAMAGPNRSLEMLIQRHGSGKAEWLEVETSSNLKQLDDWPMIGIQPMPSLTVGERPQAVVLPQLLAEPALQTGDRIIRVNGQDVQPGDYPILLATLAAQVDEPVVLTVERANQANSTGSHPQPTRLEVTLSPRPMRGVGLAMQMEPIAAIQDGSPAQQAGLQVGDIIQAVNGQPVHDPMKLEHTLRRLAGQSVQLTVIRRAGRADPPQTLTAVPIAPEQYQRNYQGWEPVGCYSLGIAFPLGKVVGYVQPDSPAHRAGLQPGDVVTKADVVVGGGVAADLAKRLKAKDYAVDLEEHPRAWPVVWETIQWMPDGAELKLHVRRDKQTRSVVLQPVREQGWYTSERWLMLSETQRVHRASSVPEAAGLGLRETYEGIMQVLGTLKKLVLNEVKLSKLGGPATILTYAGIEASHGLPRLLVFLTLLSANLAVLNILPIPVLDGGHLLFLLYEGIWGKPPNERIALALTMAGLSFILALMIFVLGMDIYRLAGFFS